VGQGWFGHCCVQNQTTDTGTVYALCQRVAP
jgi:hypothetical protein